MNSKNGVLSMFHLRCFVFVSIHRQYRTIHPFSGESSFSAQIIVHDLKECLKIISRSLFFLSEIIQ